MERLKKAVEAALPMLAVLAALSPNKYDDLIVKLLRSLLKDEAVLQAAYQAIANDAAESSAA